MMRPSATSIPPSASQPTRCSAWRFLTLMQFREGLSDRQATEAVRTRIGWKYLLALDLADPGFDHSVPREFRAHLLEHQAGERLLARVLEAGLLKARGRQRTDSRHVLAAARDLNRVELRAETLRAALNAIPAVAADWLQRLAGPKWHKRYDHRVEERACRGAGPSATPMWRRSGRMASGFWIHSPPRTHDPRPPDCPRSRCCAASGSGISSVSTRIAIRESRQRSRCGPCRAVVWTTGSSPPTMLMSAPRRLARRTFPRANPHVALGRARHFTPISSTASGRLPCIGASVHPRGALTSSRTLGRVSDGRRNRCCDDLECLAQIYWTRIAGIDL